MADHTDEEPLDNLMNNETENSSGEILPQKDTETINPIQESENMEVHQHSHSHGKKNWKSYLWEFLMLFFAVFCGFLAEYQLEHTIEHNREKEYIISMIEDAQTDTANIHRSLALNKQRILNMDSLALLCFNYDAAKNYDSSIYRFYRSAIKHPELVSPTERTLSQLKNAGGMRLIRNKDAVDKIILYDAAGKKIKEQEEFYELYQNELGKHAFELLNFGNYNSSTYTGLSISPKLLNNDKAKLIVFGNLVSVYCGVLIYYNMCLQEMEKDAIALINTLKKKYDIE